MKRNLKMKILAVAISAILLADSAFSAAVLRNSRFLTTNEQKFVRKSALRENQATEAKYSDESSLQTGRQARQDASAMIGLATQFLPLIMSFFNNAGEASSSAASDLATSSTQAVEKLESVGDTPAIPPENPFSWQNMISTGLKLFLTLMTSQDAIDKSDNFPAQAVLGTVISAVTGSTNPKEVATMARQATEVIGIVMSLFEALQTSFSS